MAATSCYKVTALHLCAAYKEENHAHASVQVKGELIHRAQPATHDRLCNRMSCKTLATTHRGTAVTAPVLGSVHKIGAERFPDADLTFTLSDTPYSRSTLSNGTCFGFLFGDSKTNSAV